MVDILKELLETVAGYPKITTGAVVILIQQFVPNKYVGEISSIVYKISKWGVRVADQLHGKNPDDTKDLKKRLERVEKKVDKT